MRAVVDPNVLISAVISGAGPPRRIVSAWGDGQFELVTSPALLSELAGVLARPKFRRWVSIATASAFVDGLQDATLFAEDPPSQPGLSPDPGDDYLIGLARATSADYLVSGDPDLLGLSDPEPPVLTPRQFFDLVTADDAS